MVARGRRTDCRRGRASRDKQIRQGYKGNRRDLRGTENHNEGEARHDT